MTINNIWNFLAITLLVWAGPSSVNSTSLYQELDRIEPPFWWADMAHPLLQLMIKEPSVAECHIRSLSDDIQILAAHPGDSPNYMFVDLDIQEAEPGMHHFELVRNGEVTGQFAYELKERTPGIAEREGFDASDVLYLITPDRFANGDPSNDEVEGMREGLNRSEPYGRHGGDLKGISDHLDYIKELGFTAIWLNPVLENDQDRWSYHGYSTTDYYKVDPRFGSNEEYVKLSQKASSMGIKLIMDMIENHCGSKHWWMEDLPFDDWLNFQGEPYQQTNHRKSTLNDPYVSKIDRKIMTDGWFVPSMPDLNQRNPFMATYLIQNSIWWIEYAQLGGIRQDTYSYPYRDFMTDWTCRIMKEYPNFNIVAEEWTENPATIAYWLRDKVNHDGYTSCLRSAMDFPLNSVLAQAVTEKENWGSGLIRLYESLANDFLYPHPYDLVVFPDNHDMSRIYTQVNEDMNAYKLALAFILTTRGVPQIYYGTEILMSNPGTDSHGIIRSDFPGGWPGDSKNAFTGQNLSDKERDAREFLRTLLNWRKSKPVIHYGELTHFIPRDGVYVYFRYNDSEKVMVILNKNKEDYDLPLKRFGEMLEGHSSGMDVITGRTFEFGDQLTLPSRSPLVIELE